MLQAHHNCWAKTLYVHDNITEESKTSLTETSLMEIDVMECCSFWPFCCSTHQFVPHIFTQHKAHLMLSNDVKHKWTTKMVMQYFVVTMKQDHFLRVMSSTWTWAARCNCLLLQVYCTSNFSTYANKAIEGDHWTHLSPSWQIETRCVCERETVYRTVETELCHN